MLTRLKGNSGGLSVNSGILVSSKETGRWGSTGKMAPESTGKGIQITESDDALKLLKMESLLLHLVYNNNYIKFLKIL